MKTAESPGRPTSRALAFARLSGALRQAIADLSIDAHGARHRLADPAAAAAALPDLRRRLDDVLDGYDALARAAAAPPIRRRPAGVE